MEHWVRMNKEAYLHHIILLSQKPDPRRCKPYTLIKKCKCVEFELFLVQLDSFFMTLSLFAFSFQKTWAIFSSSTFLSFFSRMLFQHGFIFMPFFSMNIFSFCIAHIFFGKGGFLKERVMTWSFFIWWTDGMFLCNSQCKSWHIISGCT